MAKKKSFAADGMPQPKHPSTPHLSGKNKPRLMHSGRFVGWGQINILLCVYTCIMHADFNQTHPNPNPPKAKPQTPNPKPSAA